MAKLARQRATANLIDNLLPQTQFTETLSQSIHCLLCNKILRHPLQLSCGHRVCRTCYEEFRNANEDQYCPVDNELIEDTFPDMSALVEIMYLECFCLCREEGCEWKGCVLELEGHLGVCEYNSRDICPYSDFHCNFSGNKWKIESHLHDDLRKHDSLVATCLSEVMNGFNVNRNILNDVKEKGLSIERDFRETREKSKAIESKLVEVSKLLDGQDVKTNILKEQQKRIEDLLKVCEEKKVKFLEFHDKFGNLVTKVDTQMAIFNEASSYKDKTFSENKRTLFDKVQRLIESNKEHETQMADLSVKIRIFQCSSYNGFYIWKLDNLRDRFSEAFAGKVDELYTPPLYTSPFGYKYSAKVMLYGTKGKTVNSIADHLSFYIIIMQGDYDEILQFPFPYPITISLLNTSKKGEDIIHTLYPDNNKVHFQKPYSNMNPAIGFSKFCSHHQLKSGGFITNDAIYFKIVVEKSGIGVKEPDI